MLDVKGMTKAGIERKATCQALFAKLLYLAGNVFLRTEVKPSHNLLTFESVWGTECDSLLPQDSELAQKTNVPDVFGATQEDTDGLRIVSLEEMDLDMLEGQFDHTDGDEAS
ncbi:hypothetical protein ABBQ32_005160 [Trebouxia sp. C0010 RCD-2024]